MASVRREGRDVDRVREQAGQAEAAAEREHRGEQRQQRRPQRAERDREHDRGGDEADELARAAALLLRGLLDPAAAELDLQAVAARAPPRWRSACRRPTSARRRSAARRPCARWRTRPCRPCEICRAAAPCANGLSTRSTCGPLAIASERLLDPRLGRRVVDVVGREHHLVGVGRLGVEVVGEQVQRRRGLRARQRERVGVARSRRWRSGRRSRTGRRPRRRGRRTCGGSTSERVTHRASLSGRMGSGKCGRGRSGCQPPAP